MNGFMKYDHGTLASAYFEHTRRTDADFRKCVYDSKFEKETVFGRLITMMKNNDFNRIAMYKTTYERHFYWPESVSNCDNRRVESGFATIPKLTEDQLKKLYTPKIIFRKLSDNKRIEPPLDYSKDTRLMGAAAVEEESKNSTEKFEKSLYQATYCNVNHTPCRANKIEETPEEWVQKWENECYNLRDADDLVQDWSHRVIDAQKMSLNRKRIGYD